jgi:hypothetical protein
MASKHYRRDRTHVLGEPTFAQRDRETGGAGVERGFNRRLARARRKRTLW